MKTEDLIDVLSRDSAAPRASHRQRFVLALSLGLVAGMMLLVGIAGPRPDMGEAMMPVMWKALFSAFAASASIPLLLRLARPGRPIGWRIGAIAGFVLLCAALAGIALMTAEPGTRMTAWTGGHFPWCLVAIPVLGAPTAALLTWMLRDLAPTQVGLVGAAMGAVAGGVGAVAYSFYCPIDSIAFVTTWYVVAIAICAALGAVFGSFFLRW